MFSSRALQQIAKRVPKSRPLSSAAPVRDGVFREKTTKGIWLGDKGAFPIMSITVVGACCCASFGVFYLLTSPDVRLTPGSSRSKMFRADIAHDYIKEDVDVCK